VFLNVSRGGRVLVSALAMANALLASPAAGAEAPQIRPFPKTGPPTKEMRLQGRGFEALEQIRIRFDREPVGLVSADDAGQFATRFHVPADALPGEHTIFAKGLTSDHQDDVPFTVRTDWLQFHFGPDHQGLNPYENVLSPSTVGGLQEKWAAPTDGNVQASPVVADGMVYTGGNGGIGTAYIYAFDAATGELVWRRPTQGLDTQNVAVYRGRAFIGTLDDHTLHAYDARTGARAWALHAAGAVSGPTIAYGHLYVQTNSGDLYRLDPANGRIIWRADYRGDSAANPAVAHGLVFAGGGVQGTVTAFAAGSGKRRWIAHLAVIVDSSPAVWSSRVYVGSVEPHGIWALDAETGDVEWFTPTADGVTSAPTVAEGIVYCGSYDGTVYALDAKTGEQVWAASAGSVIGLASPVAANGVVYVGSDTGVFAFDAASGEQLWFYDIGQVNAAPAVADGVVYIGDFDARLHAFALPG
jgi:outer membrane protein assembly factor BamB